MGASAVLPCAISESGLAVFLVQAGAGRCSVFVVDERVVTAVVLPSVVSILVVSELTVTNLAVLGLAVPALVVSISVDSDFVEVLVVLSGFAAPGFVVSDDVSIRVIPDWLVVVLIAPVAASALRTPPPACCGACRADVGARLASNRAVIAAELSRVMTDEKILIATTPAMSPLSRGPHGEPFDGVPKLTTATVDDHPAASARNGGAACAQQRHTFCAGILSHGNGGGGVTAGILPRSVRVFP